MLQQAASNSPSGQVADQAIPVVPVAPRQSGARITGPVLGGLCCLGLTLFLIAATIVLSLIPVYINRNTVTPAQRTQVIILQTPSGSTLQPGSLNAAQRQALQNYLQSVLNNDPRTRGVQVRVVEATAINNSGRKRQIGGATAIQVVIIITNGSRNAQAIALLILDRLVIPQALLDLLERLGNTVPSTTIAAGFTTTTTTVVAGVTTTTVVAGVTTTTVATTVTTTTIATTVTTNTSRVLVRRSLEDGGAPAGIVYIDSHRVAEKKGLVSTVSFYADQTCALSTVEFGAFDLTNRYLDINNAELVLTHRSGAIKLDEVYRLKPYMSLITIELCNENTNYAPNGGVCKGTKFQVLPHQYIGIRSDKCRLGFAPTPFDPIIATTWRPDDESDPFDKPYKTVKYVPSDYTVLHSTTIESAELQQNQDLDAQKSAKGNAPRALFIGSFPPRRCGIAKFLEDLTDNYSGSYGVIAVDEQDADLSSRDYSDKVVYRLNQTNRDAYFTMVDITNSGAFDVVNVQHEYGLFGGMMGEYILHYLSSVRKPIVSTLHTVIPEPNAFTIALTRSLCALSTRVIVMADLGRRLLIDVYGIDESKIVLIPHGVPNIAFDHSLANAKAKIGLDSNVPTMCTFGLIHRNKNIQYALKAMQSVVQSVPNMMYLVIGQTHPAILKYEGEVYRKELEGNVSALGLTNNVRFINKFVDNNELLNYLGASDIYLTPYAREDQYVSGTLSWAVGLGKVVVSTPYLYAKELLAHGRGFLVPFNDDKFLSSTIVKVVQDEQVRNVARRQAYRHGRQMSWPHVTKDLEQLFRELMLFT